MTYLEFNAKYGLFITEQIYGDWLPVAIVRAAIFPLAYRPLAIEFYTAYLLCITGSDRTETEIKKFEVKPEGYSVEYGGGGAKCDRWINSLKQLALTAEIELPETRKFGTLGGDRTECFDYQF